MSPSHLTLIFGGGPQAVSLRPSLARPTLRVIQGGSMRRVDQTLVDAIETARTMRLQIEQRIARALDPLDEHH